MVSQMSPVSDVSIPVAFQNPVISSVFSFFSNSETRVPSILRTHVNTTDEMTYTASRWCGTVIRTLALDRRHRTFLAMRLTASRKIDHFVGKASANKQP